MTLETHIKHFKNHCSKKLGYKPDFRTQKYVKNSFGLSPIFEESEARQIIKALYDYANEHMQKNREFFGFEYNLSMQVNALKTSSLKMLVSDVLEHLVIFDTKK